MKKYGIHVVGKNENLEKFRMEIPKVGKFPSEVGKLKANVMLDTPTSIVAFQLHFSTLDLLFNFGPIFPFSLLPISLRTFKLLILSN